MTKLKQIDGGEDLKASINKALEADSELGKEVMRQYRFSVLNKDSIQIGDYKLQQLLTECFNARDDRTLCDEADFMSKYPGWTGMPVSIVAFKVNILVALIREGLIDVASAPFIIDPTPNPDIPDAERERILSAFESDFMKVVEQIVEAQKQYVMEAVTRGLTPEQASMMPDFPRTPETLAVDMAKALKVKMHQDVKDHADAQAVLLQRDIYDKTIEGGYRRAVIEFADDFATYPFACIHGPFPTVSYETVWKNNTFVEEKQVVWAFERISPFDVYWTEDSTNTQDGTAVFIVKKVSYDYLYDAKRMAEDDPKSGYRLKAIKDLIERTKVGKVPRNWTNFFHSNPEYKGDNLVWSRGQNVDILIRYGRFTGHDLLEMGFLDVEDTTLYETKIVMCGGQVIYCQLNKNPGKYKRPIFTASFESRNGSIAGVGLGQKLLSIHKAYRAVVHLAMYNLGLSSEPITEVEVNRILQYMPEDWIDEPTITPGQVIPADGDRMGNGSRAIKFTQIPNTTDSALRLAQFIFEQAHVISNIPAALHGQPVGSGANRTVRGLLTLQGNTLKPIHSGLINLDLGVIEPMVTLLYMLLVMYDDTFDYSGDSKIVAKGAASMIQREMDKQTAMENIQILGQAGQIGIQLNPELFSRTYTRLLSIAGILEPGEEALNTAPPPTQPPPSAQPQP